MAFADPPCIYIVCLFLILSVETDRFFYEGRLYACISIPKLAWERIVPYVYTLDEGYGVSDIAQ